MFWLSREASAAATAGLTDIAMDDSSEGSVPADALFFLAQRPNGEGIQCPAQWAVRMAFQRSSIHFEDSAQPSHRLFETGSR